ncbi:MAG: COX15/CtaA family protein, partial [Verrucomicrobiota bacterium]
MQPENRWISRLAKFAVIVTFSLIYLGGMVTSLNAGLSVPDWPTSFGYNMFTFPVSKWEGGIWWEHSHRLVASFLGLVITVLAVWIWRVDSRRWVRGLGLGAFVLVVVQGILGGLRVTEISTVLAIIHGCIAQAFLCVLILLALALSPAWERPPTESKVSYSAKRLVPWGWVLTGAVFIQLILGAIMRHLHAGLAIPTFPLTPSGSW